MTSYWRLSQNHLKTLETCPPQFQKIYLQQLKNPYYFNQEEKTEWGKKFHLLMQQYDLGLPIENFSPDDIELQNSVQALISVTKDIWNSPDIIARKAEFQINYTIKNYLLTCRYDLLVLYQNKAVIHDWKTYLQPTDNKLNDDWQTKLYLYILAEKFDYKPHQLYFTYWFVKLPQKPQKLTITYSKSKHERTKQELEVLLDKLDSLTQKYVENKENLPHKNSCESCPYYDSFSNLLSHDNLLENSLMCLDDL